MHSNGQSDSSGRPASHPEMTWALLLVPVFMALGVSALVWTRIAVMDAIIDKTPHAKPIFNDPMMVSLGLRYFLLIAPVQLILVIVLRSMIQRCSPVVKWFLTALVWLVFVGALWSYAGALAEIGLPALCR